MRAAAIVVVTALSLCAAAPAAAQEFRGLIEPHRVIKVGSPQAGVLATVDVDRGDFVRKGQVLATLQSDVERAAMELARFKAGMDAGIKAKQGGLLFYEGKRQRIEQLHKKEMAAQAEMDEAETNRLLAEMQLKESLENKRLSELEYKRAAEIMHRMTIRSPIDGVVMERLSSPGEYVEKEPVLKIGAINPLNVEVIMPAALLTTVKVGMHATVIPEAPVNGQYTATVKIIDRVVDAASGTFGVRLQLPNPGNRLPAGLKAKVIFPKK
jgi:RND family efflux transporter MFP subunit